MFYLDPSWLLRIYREKRDLEQDWKHLRAWVQYHQGDLRLGSIAKRAGVSAEMGSLLLLREEGKVKIKRDWDRLDAFIIVFMSPPFCYSPPWWEEANEWWEQKFKPQE